MQENPPARVTQAVHAASRFAIPFTAIALFRVGLGVVRGSAPVSYLVIVPVLGFGIFFLLTLLLQLSGAVTRDPSKHLQLDVNPWFAWLVCGGLVFFFVGLLARGSSVLAEDAPRVGLLSAVAWAGVVAIVWMAVRLFARRGA